MIVKIDQDPGEFQKNLGPIGRLPSRLLEPLPRFPEKSSLAQQDSEPERDFGRPRIEFVGSPQSPQISIGDGSGGKGMGCAQK